MNSVSKSRFIALSFLATLIGPALLFSACGPAGSDGDQPGEGGSSLTYQIVINRCDTGSHTFSTMDAYCAGLQDETLNNGCGGEDREKRFKANCSGKTWALTNVKAISCGSQSCDGATQFCLTSFGGSSKTPLTSPVCRDLPAGTSLLDVYNSCDLLIEDANRYVFPTTDNCRQRTTCGRKQAGGFYLECRVTI